MSKIVWDNKVNTKILGIHDQEIRASDINGLKASVNALYDAGGDLPHEYACLYISSAAETSITSVDTPILVAGITSEVISSDNITISAAGRATYTGEATRVFKVDAAMTMTSTGNNKVVSLYIAKNGVVISASKQQRFIATGSDVGNAGTTCLPTLSTGDYVELFIENNTDNTNVTAELMNFNITSVN